MTEEGGNLPGVCSFDSINISRAVVGDAATETSPLRITDINDVATFELAFNLLDTGRKQAAVLLPESEGCAGIHHQLSFGGEAAEHPALTTLQLAGRWQKTGASSLTGSQPQDNIRFPTIGDKYRYPGGGSQFSRFQLGSDTAGTKLTRRISRQSFNL